MKVRLTVTVACLAATLFALGSAAALAQQSDTRNDLSLTPWIDPDDSSIIRLNKDDPTIDAWNARNEGIDNSKPGVYDPNRYAGGFPFGAFPTFLFQPIARTPEDLKAGDVDLAIVGSSTDMNSILGTSYAAHVIRAYVIHSASQFNARGDGKMKRERDVMPVDQYVRSSINELNIVDYGNIMRHQMSGEKSTEEIRTVLGEIYEGGAIPMLVGGSHDNMYGLFLAVADQYGKGNYCVLHFDSHMDNVSAGYGFWVHNANGIYMGVKKELFKGEDLVQVGMTSLGPDDGLLKWAKEAGGRWHFQAEIERDGWVKVMERTLADVKDCENLVVTLDIDIMDQADVPGTGGREPDGPRAQEMMRMMRALGIQNNLVAIEISEYNPMLDSRAYTTATVVRQLMLHTIYGMAARKRGITDPFYCHPDMCDYQP